MTASPNISVAQAIEDIRAGKMVIVVDDQDRENEGDLTMAADLVTPEAINFMAGQGRGLICLAITENRVAELRLTNPGNPPFGIVTVSVGAATLGPADLDQTADQWFARVDSALYEAKSAGRNQVAAE